MVGNTREQESIHLSSPDPDAKKNEAGSLLDVFESAIAGKDQGN